MLELKAKKRDILGKKVTHLRREGFLPAVVYGEKVKSESVSVPYIDFEKVYREAGGSSLIALTVDGTPHNVLIVDVKRDPIKGTPLHADFYAVRMDKVIRAKVPIEFIGESPAVKNEGGILVKVMHELEVEALPKDLPHEIKIDLVPLAAIHAKIAIKDITAPAGTKILGEPDDIIVLVDPPRSEEELAELEKPAEEAPVAEIKTEREIKTELKKQKEAEIAAAEEVKNDQEQTQK